MTACSAQSPCPGPHMVSMWVTFTSFLHIYLFKTVSGHERSRTSRSRGPHSRGSATADRVVEDLSAKGEVLTKHDVVDRVIGGETFRIEHYEETWRDGSATSYTNWYTTQSLPSSSSYSILYIVSM